METSGVGKGGVVVVVESGSQVWACTPGRR